MRPSTITRKEAPERYNERGLPTSIAANDPLTITRKEPTYHNYRLAHKHTTTRKEKQHNC